MSSIQNVQGTSSAAMASLLAARRQAPSEVQPPALEGAALDAQEGGAAAQAEGTQDNDEAIRQLTQYQAGGKPQQEGAAPRGSGMDGWSVNILA